MASKTQPPQVGCVKSLVLEMEDEVYADLRTRVIAMAACGGVIGTTMEVCAFIVDAIEKGEPKVVLRPKAKTAPPAKRRRRRG